VDELPVMQTPLRWFWAPVAADAPADAPAGATIVVGADDAFTIGAARQSGAPGWRLAGFGDWLGWTLVRYLAFPVIAAALAAALFFMPFFVLERTAMALGRRLWDPPTRALAGSVS
jgi:hypothetical protein